MSALVYETVNKSLVECIEYFSCYRSDVSSEAVLQALIKIQDNVAHIKIVAEYIEENAHKYDVVPGLQANGYRSWLRILESFLLATIKLLCSLSSNCRSTFFRGNEYSYKLRLTSDVLHQLRAMFYYAQILMELTPDGDLFVDENASEPLMHDCEVLAKACFYGSMHGFQYAEGILPIVHGLSLFVAQYNDIHEPSGAWKTFKSAFKSGRYVLSPELRGEKLEEVYNGGDVQFFKKFWSIAELGIIQAVPSLVATSVRVNRHLQITPDPFYLESRHSESDDVRINFTSTLGSSSKQISARLISAILYEGQVQGSSNVDADRAETKTSNSKKANTPPKSKNLLFFCHGGGFVALTTKSYESVLREWSRELDSPVFSVDYSLAPEAPFPEGLEECFYAYAWALKNAEQLGTTAENVVLAGDSAGGNLVLSVALRAGLYGIKMPNSIVTMYPAGVVRYSASPARLMSVMDPLLPLGLLSGCLGAYSGVKTEKLKRDDVNGNYKPTTPSKQPVQFRYLSTLVKDVGEGFNRMRVGDSTGPKSNSSSPEEEDFTHVTLEELGGESRAPGDARDSFVAPEFKIKLPHNFKPLKGKFCGDNFRMHRSPMVKNAFLSPALADDNLLKALPHVDIVGCEFDPLLDDSVLLAKRLEKIGCSYQLHVVRGLPHGFLNFQIAREAKGASRICLELIRKGLRVLKP